MFWTTKFLAAHTCSTFFPAHVMPTDCRSTQKLTEMAFMTPQQHMPQSTDSRGRKSVHIATEGKHETCILASVAGGRTGANGI